MRVLGGASTLPRQPLLECNEDGHADNGYDVEHFNHGVHHAPCDEPRLQSVINYGLKFSGVVVTTIGRESGPINLKISVWPYISKRADAQTFHGALVGDHGNPERSTQAAGGHFAVQSSCPLCPRKRTLSMRVYVR